MLVVEAIMRTARMESSQVATIRGRGATQQEAQDGSPGHSARSAGCPPSDEGLASFPPLWLGHSDGCRRWPQWKSVRCFPCTFSRCCIIGGRANQDLSALIRKLISSAAVSIPCLAKD